MSAAILAELKSPPSLRPIETTFVRPESAKDAAGQELLLPSEGADTKSANKVLGLINDPGTRTGPRTKQTAVSSASSDADEDTTTSASMNMSTDQPMDATPCLRFNLNDTKKIREHLDEFGFAVVAAMGSTEAHDAAEKLLFTFLEEHAGWDPMNPSTWTTESFEKVGDPYKGILYKCGIGQSHFQWFIRTQPGVRAAFEAIWGTNDLLTSFDGCNVFRPWHRLDADPSWKTVGGWWHVDQGKSKLGRHAVQGLVTLRDANAQTGGLCVIPGSHRHHKRIVGGTEGYADFVCISDDDPVMDLPKKLVVAQAGDLVLWDSRTVHCNTPALETPTEAECRTTDFLRVVSYVCMTPREFSDPTIIRARERAYESRMTTGHWPHLMPLGTCGKEVSGELDFTTASTEVQRLVSGLGD